jgi:hypothetical protein
MVQKWRSGTTFEQEHEGIDWRSEHTPQHKFVICQSKTLFNIYLPCRAAHWAAPSARAQNLTGRVVPKLEQILHAWGRLTRHGPFEHLYL